MTDQSTPIPPIADAVQAIAEAVSEVAAAEDTPEAYLAAHHACVQAAKVLRFYMDDFEQRAIKRWPEGDRRLVSIDRIGTFRVGRRAARTSWDLRKASHAVVDKAMERGQIVNPRDAADVIMAALTGSPGFRLDTLKSYELNPDEYRATEPGELKIEAV